MRRCSRSHGDGAAKDRTSAPAGLYFSIAGRDGSAKDIPFAPVRSAEQDGVMPSRYRKNTRDREDQAVLECRPHRRRPTIAPTKRKPAMTPSPIELRHLRVFLAAAEHGSFRKAAAWLEIRQSSVSRRIRDLERQLGSALFIRHPGGVRMTDAGQRFSWRVTDIFHRLQTATEEAKATTTAAETQTKVEFHTRDTETASLTIALTIRASRRAHQS